MAKKQPWKDEGLTKAEWVAREVADTVQAGRQWSLDGVDFNDPLRPKTCLEVDFPIIPINETAGIEASSGAATKPVYQLSKWWARRQASVFRSMILAASIKAPDDPAEAAKLVWNTYYGNHKSSERFRDLVVADIFMGGGTTLVEGSRLGATVIGNDLNPVSWFIVNNTLSRVPAADVESLLAAVEDTAKPRLAPFYACDCPRGHTGRWMRVADGLSMGTDFDPFSVPSDDRGKYCYHGPTVTYTFWAKHGPCQATGCGHRTPIVGTPVFVTKAISTKYWDRECRSCGGSYHIEAVDTRLAPGAEQVAADCEGAFATADLGITGAPKTVICPHCLVLERLGVMHKPQKKSVQHSLVIHPDWLKGHEGTEVQSGEPFGGTANSSPDATVSWLRARSQSCSIIEFRGPLPEQFTTADGSVIRTGTDAGNIPGRSSFTCQGPTCGREHDVLEAVRATETTAPFAPFAYQVFCPECDSSPSTSGGRFYVPASETLALEQAEQEWHARKDADLAEYWPRSELSQGWKTHGWAVPEHGYTHYHRMFFSRQLLQHAELLKAIMTARSVDVGVRDLVVGAFLQFLRYSSGFTFWHQKNNQISAFLSNNNFQMKNTVVETAAYSPVGDGSFLAASSKILESLGYLEEPWDLVRKETLSRSGRDDLAKLVTGRTKKVFPGDSPANATIGCGSSSDLHWIRDASVDLVITDPPFGEIMQYAELSDFFYVWLRLAVKDRFPDHFEQEFTPKALEAVSNPFRNDTPDEFYSSVLTQCWAEAHRILKPGGLLAFTFHHDKDAPWVTVLQSLFVAGFCLEATYPIRGDASKGDTKVAFGAEKVEYDIIHVCRKRTDAPVKTSWAKLRRRILQDVRSLQEILEHHQEEGLPEADLQVIRRGKALEYFSRHYGQVYKDPDTPMSVLEALLGINQLLDEEAGGAKEPPPHNAEPFTRMMLRLFDGVDELPRDQMQKFLRGTGSAPSDFMGRGWVTEKKKVFYLVPPLDIAREWVGKQRRGMTSDYDQAMYLIGACFENSGINATETLNNANFRPHPALGAILTWFKTHGADSPTRNAAITASQLYKAWEAKNQPKAKELTLFDMLGEDD